MDSSQRNLALENGPAATFNQQGDLRTQLQRLFGHQNGWTERTAAVVHLGLREIKRVLSFDIAGRNIITKGVPDDFCIPINDENEFRLRHTPTCVPTNSDLAVGSDNPPTRRFKEKLRPLGVVDSRIKHCSPTFLGFFAAAFPAPLISDTSCPNLLSSDRS